MAEPIPAAWADVVLAVQSRLVAVLGWDGSRIGVVAEGAEDVPRLVGESDLLLISGGEQPREGFDGGGRYQDLRNRTLTVAPRTRCELDEPDRDLYRLTVASTGLLRLEDQIADALEGWTPQDADGNDIALPLVLGTLDRARRLRRNPTWAAGGVEFKTGYQRKYTLPEAPEAT